MAQDSNSTPQPQSGYVTPDGLHQGQPPIATPKTPGFTPTEYVPVGGVIVADTPIEYNTGRRTVSLKVHNTGDRPVQVGSHYHFFEVNRYLEFDRPQAFGKHLNIPATTAIRFEPGEEREVELVEYAGKHRIIGFDDLVNGFAGYEDSPAYYPKRIEAMRKMREYGYKSVEEDMAEAEYSAQQVSNPKS